MLCIAYYLNPSSSLWGRDKHFHITVLHAEDWDISQRWQDSKWTSRNQPGAATVSQPQLFFMSFGESSVKHRVIHRPRVARVSSSSSSRKLLSCTLLNLHFFIIDIHKLTCCASLTGHTFVSQQSSCWLMILFILHFHALREYSVSRTATTDVQQHRAVIVRVGVQYRNPVLNPIWN